MTTAEPAMKTCFKCNIAKPLEDFYKHPRMEDGRLGKCKECTKRSVRENRAAKLSYYQEYDRQRSSLEHRLRARLAYDKTARGAEAHRKATDSWDARNPLKKGAQTMLGNAVRDGKVKKLPCEVCGRTDRIHGHHDDYAKPLEVRWLCATHHAAHHKHLRALAREQRAA